MSEASWAIKRPDGAIEVDSTASEPGLAISLFMVQMASYVTWAYWHSEGYRVVPVEIKEVEGEG